MGRASYYSSNIHARNGVRLFIVHFTFLLCNQALSYCFHSVDESTVHEPSRLPVFYTYLYIHIFIIKNILSDFKKVYMSRSGLSNSPIKSYHIDINIPIYIHIHIISNTRQSNSKKKNFNSFVKIK